MATRQINLNPKKKKEFNFDYVKSFAQLVEVATRLTAGAILLNNFDQAIAIGVGLYMIATGLIHLAITFLKAYK